MLYRIVGFNGFIKLQKRKFWQSEWIEVKNNDGGELIFSSPSEVKSFLNDLGELNTPKVVRVIEN